MSEFSAYLAERVRRLERALDETVPADGSRLTEAMRYSLLAGGKRIRPILLVAAGEAVGGEEERLLPFAVAVEMIHTYSLIHDDLPAMDDDALRRGRPTSHVRYGEALAILAGDGLLTDAFAVMAEAAVSFAEPTAAIRAIGEIAAAAGAGGMVAGQADDIAAEGGDADLASVESIHRRKTGALLRAAVRSGGILAGAGEVALRGLTTYGDRLGLAFQVVDDVLDVSAPTAVTGKAEGRDRERGKSTYVQVLGVEGARRRALDLGNDAVTALQDLGAGAEVLRALARFVVDQRL
jgi:geranylgeranyl diphosphate synthase type II